MGVLDRLHTKKILLGNVYRALDESPIEAVDQLDRALRAIPNLDKYEIPIMGDLNIDYKTKLQPPTGNLEQFAMVHNLKQMINQPTRGTTARTIDLAFTNIKYCTGAGTISYNISDHKPI
jgi:hypothetical protein